MSIKRITGYCIMLLMAKQVQATTFYLNTVTGNDNHTGNSIGQAWQTLARANAHSFQPGDTLLFAAGQVFSGTLALINVAGTQESPVIIDRYFPTTQHKKSDAFFAIDAKGMADGILLQNCSYVQVRHGVITANGYHTKNAVADMRVGLRITATAGNNSNHLKIDSIVIHDVYFENNGFVRGKEEVKTANGTQRYGWGIRLMATESSAKIYNIDISNCKVSNVSHTGIKLTGSSKNIYQINIHHNSVAYTGGPGMQMSEVRKVHVHHNSIDHSGSEDDTRKWGRGSGLWTWGASEVLIEHNRFTNANGPGDSAGAHIDFNCDNVIVQYNFSGNNAGGFCEILGNNYNCAYRFNISVNDGYRIKGKNGAFQEGKMFWLSGYQGDKKPRKGPVNSYFYNNTIYVDSTITARVAIDATSKGILIANNIFYIRGKSQTVLGDQYKADDGSGLLTGSVFFANNLWLKDGAWPADAAIQDSLPIVGNPDFLFAGGWSLSDYLPQNARLVKQTGIPITRLPGDAHGLLQGMNLNKDIMGKTIAGSPPIGAIACE